jgi:hypothetical protein
MAVSHGVAGGRLLGAPARYDLAAPRLFGLRHQRGALRLGRRRCALDAVVPRAVEAVVPRAVELGV